MKIKQFTRRVLNNLELKFVKHTFLQLHCHHTVNKAETISSLKQSKATYQTWLLWAMSYAYWICQRTRHGIKKFFQVKLVFYKFKNYMRLRKINLTINW